jgi:hypothetical protein
METTHLSYDKLKALQDSYILLDKIATPISHRNNANHGNIVLSTCFFCKSLMPLISNNQCKLCDEMFCGRHKTEVNHACEKLSKDTAKYLNAKNQFKLRLREAKNKAVR